MSTDTPSADKAQKTRKKLTDAQKKDLQEFKAWRGQEQMVRLKEHQIAGRKLKKAVREAMTAGPATIPELASATGLAASDVLWHVTALKKYGEARETEVDGDYARYELVTNKA